MKLNENGAILPRVLLATPVSSRHAHLLDEWLESLNNLTYPIFDVLLVDTTPDTDEYYKLLLTKQVKGKNINVIRHEWDYKKYHSVQWMAFAREKIREFFLKDNYEFLMSLDDDIFLPEWGIQRLLSYDKDQVGFYVHVYFEPDTKPCILKNGEIVMGQGLQYFNWTEIDAYKDFIERMKLNTLTENEINLVPFIVKDPYFPQLFNPYATNLGCLMIKRKVLESIEFKTHETFVMGEDLWYFIEADEKRFESWCDSSFRCIHKNTEWGSVVQKGPKGVNPGFWIAMGPSDAKKAEFIDHDL